MATASLPMLATYQAAVMPSCDRAIALYTVFGFVLYHDLRIAKDGVETAEISAVFE
jgi:hypothetical protein